MWFKITIFLVQAQCKHSINLEVCAPIANILNISLELTWTNANNSTQEYENIFGVKVNIFRILRLNFIDDM
jgi:hypothetical protein